MYGYVIAKFSRMGSFPHFLTHGATLRARELRCYRYEDYYYCYYEDYCNYYYCFGRC